MSNKTKDLMLIVVNDNPVLIPVMHQLSHYVYRDVILKWLLNNNIIGRNLADWLKITHNNSILGMVKFILRIHNKDQEEKAIVLNRDWVK